MLERNFTPPPADVSERETERRMRIINQVTPQLAPAAEAIVITGSMAYGRNYSVTATSDIDVQVLLEPHRSDALLKCGMFEKEKLRRALDAFQIGAIKQFSLVDKVAGVSVECHFWDRAAAVSAALMESPSTLRLCSTREPPKVDYGFAFDGMEFETVLPGRMQGELIVGDLPSYTRKDGKLFLSRPVIGILGTPLVVHGEELMTPVIGKLWSQMALELARATVQPIDLSRYNVFNALPGKSKVSPESKAAITERTRRALADLRIAFA